MKESRHIGRGFLCLWGAFSRTQRKASQGENSALMSSSPSAQAQEGPLPPLPVPKP